MEVIKVNYKVYKFQELSREAKDKAIANWYEKLHEIFGFVKVHSEKHHIEI